MIDRLTIEKIMAAADIVDVVGDFVTLRRSGANYKGLCPFHNEKTPSFMVSPSKQICKCFSCGGGGNVINFVMQHEQMGYTEALKWLGRKYGIEVREKEQTEEEKTAAAMREAMFVLNDWARDFFSDTLHNHVDGIAIGMSYFRRRGLRDDIIRKFQLGYSPEQRDAFAIKAKSKGFEEKYIEATGLCYRTDDGKLLDRYHGRVIFPVHTVSGRVVAFGGRILNTENKKVGKYVNSPESEIYSKKKELYGLYLAKQAIVKQDRCYLVEGYLDVISMHQNGVENVVASSGTALTPEQVRLIHRFTNNVTVLYDGDAAGIHASLRGIDILLSEGLNIKVLLLPDGEDPDSFAQSHSAEEFRQYIEEHQTDFIRFKTDLLMKGAAGDPTRRADVIRDIVKSIAVIPSHIVRQVYIRELSSRLGIEERIIVSEVAEENRKAQKENRKSASGINSENASIISNISSTDLSSASLQTTSADNKEIQGEGKDGEPQNTTEKPADNDIFNVISPAKRKFEACERQLIMVIVRYGEYPLLAAPEKVERKIGKEAPPSSPTEKFDSPLVAPYIFDELTADGIKLQLPLHQEILEEAARLCRTPDFQARKYFPLHHNPEISLLAAKLTDERYLLSTMQQQLYVPAEKRLIEIVPRVINDYKHAILMVEKEILMQTLREYAVSNNQEEMNHLMSRLMEINKAEMEFAKILGDRVLTS